MVCDLGGVHAQVSSDLVDEDIYLAQRPRSLSASLIASVFFFSKFSQSLAPMLGYAWPWACACVV